MSELDLPLWATTMLLVVPLLALLFAGMYVAVALGVVSFIGFYLMLGGNMPVLIGDTTFNLTNNFVLSAVPLFIFMGSLILHTCFSSGLYKGVSVFSRYVPGNLLHSNIIACTIFSACSGSSVATAAAIGTVALPEMESQGYERKITAGSLAAGGTLGPIIPPSLGFIIYGAITETSVGQLFFAGAIPGLILSAMFMSNIVVRVVLDPSLVPSKKESAMPFVEKVKTVLQAWPIFGIMLTVLGGIYLGWTTPTEAAAIGCTATMVLAAVYRVLKWEGIKDALREAVHTASMLMFIVCSAMMLGVVLANLGIPKAIVAFVLGSNVDATMVLMLLFGMYFVLGMFFDGISIMIITLPVVYPVIVNIGYDPIWFGVALMILIEVGLLTPPVGLNLYVIHGISKQRPFSEVAIGAAPFFVVMLLGLIIITVWPELALWLPGKMIPAA